MSSFLSRGLCNSNKFGQIQELTNDNYSDIKLYNNNNNNNNNTTLFKTAMGP